MNEKQPTIFPEGLIFKRPKENAPEFVKGNISVNIKTFTEFMKKFPEAEWLNIDLLMSKDKKLYLKLNTYGLKGVTKQKSNDGIDF